MKYEDIYSAVEEVFSLLSRMTVSGENTLLAGTAMMKLRELGIALRTEQPSVPDISMEDDSNGV